MSAFVGIMAAAGVAAAQGPSLIWQSREFLTNAQGQPVFGPDAGADVVTWEEPGVGIWIYVTGYHTTPSGAEVIATYKYRFDPATGQNPQWVRRAFFPDPELAVGRHRGAAITVEAATGEVYVVGEGVGANGAPDYITIKYDKDLDPNFTTVVWPSQGDGIGVRRYDFVGGPDRPVDVLFVGGPEPGQGDVVVTGTSWGGPGTGYDIATLRYGPDGEFSDKWPANTALGPKGIRRYNNVLINGSDRAAEMGFINVADTEQCGGRHVAVAGTTWNGPVNQDDFVLIKYSTEGDPGVGAPGLPCPQDGSGAPVVQWGALWPGEGMENKAQAITTFGPGFFNFFVTGVSEAFASSDDIGTIRVKRP